MNKKLRFRDIVKKKAMARKLTEYIVNVDIQVFAIDEGSAIRKIATVLAPKFKYWTGDIN